MNNDTAESRHLRSISRGSGMNLYSNGELVDMLIVNGCAYCNDHSARQLYQERYPNRRVLHYTTFASVNRRLREIDSFMS
ncbi:hypothetical protein TNCV_897301 [Trichonephila clavipes]|nr:hypothetical protein TNCV_897301 [Trichonephila clavipes]